MRNKLRNLFTLLFIVTILNVLSLTLYIVYPQYQLVFISCFTALVILITYILNNFENLLPNE
jgi:hypothetical protein